MSEGKAALNAESLISAGKNNGFASADSQLKEYRYLMNIQRG